MIFDNDGGKNSFRRTQKRKRRETQYCSTKDFFIMTFSNGFTITNIFCYVRNSLNPTTPSIFQHILCMIFIGVPLVYMKVFLGQYSQLGILNIKSLCPIAHGIGYISILTTIVWCSHYGLVLADFVVYLISSFDGVEEFMYCPKNSSFKCWDQTSNCTKDCISNKTFPATFVYWQELFMDNVNFTASEINFGQPMATRYVPLIIVWILLTGFVMTDSLGIIKVVKTNNYLILFLASTFTLVCFLTKGSSESIRLMFQTNKGSFKNVAAWSTSIYNVIRMLGIDAIGFTTYGVRLKTKLSTDILAIVSVLLIFFASALCGIVSHAMIGVILMNAHVGLEALENIWVEGTVPYFTVFLTGIVYMGVPQLWSIVYFTICILIITNNLIVSIINLEICISDAHASLRPYHNYLRISVGLVCGALVLYSHQRRVILNVSSFNVWMLSLTVFWIYGVQHLSDDIHFLRGVQPTKFWKLCWYFIPAVIFVPWTYTDFFYDNRRGYLYYPVSLLLKLPLLICGVYETFGYIKIHHILGLFQPEPRWGPEDVKERRMRQLYNPRKETRARRRVDDCDHVCFLKNPFLPKLTAMEEEARNNFVRPLESTISFVTWNLHEVLDVGSEEIFE
ncbi:hypothetical protein FQR65_LT07973 [Abscondita terminalis]|nr:hypothetical protein FQR65_LT07973 [Abscondita terminalis]